jgi:hypothetical protein
VKKSFNLLVVLIGLLLAIGLCAVVAAIINGFKPASQAAAVPTAVLTIIPAPSATPTPAPEEASSATATPNGGVGPDGIAQGMYVQISGTGGDGLKMRSGPGVKSDTIFLGMEAEVYLVKDGPKLADGYTWWYLEAPYDSTRTGWAASKYLTIVAAPK